MAVLISRVRTVKTRRGDKELTIIEGNIANNTATQAEPETRVRSLELTQIMADIYIHSDAVVSSLALLGPGTQVNDSAQIGERTTLGKECYVGKGVIIQSDVAIGDRVIIQDRAWLCSGVMIEGGVYIGPQVCFTNDRYPRAITIDGEIRLLNENNLECSLVRYGASIGAGAIILPGVRIGNYAMIGAGAVVSSSVPDQTLLVGNPARAIGYVCRCGRPLQLRSTSLSWYCTSCHENYIFPG